MDSSHNHPLSPAVLGSLRSLSVFFLPKDLIDTLTYSTPELAPQPSTPLLTSSTLQQSSLSSDHQPENILSFPLKITPSCRTCAVPMFASVEKQREHVKSDWHLYNLKQQLLDQQAAPISLLHFQDMIRDTISTAKASQENTQRQSSQSTTSTSVVLYNSSDVAVQTLMSQLEINVKENKLERSSDPYLLRQKMLQEQQLEEIRRSPILWFSSTLYGSSVQFGVYKNVLTNKGNCDHLVEHIKSIQIPVPPLPSKKAKVKRTARAKAKALLESQQKQQSGLERETEQDAITSLQIDLENEAGASPSPSLPVLVAVDDKKTPMESTPPQQPAETTDVPPRYWTMILLGGGHFAGMVIDLRGQAKKAHSQGSHIRELKIVTHKTFHRYTVRRKNGGAQSSFGGANSAGAMVRMYNERALKLEVRELLEGWSDWILQSECVFMHAPGNNKRTVFYENSVISRVDREGLLRSFPFVTKRPTLTEIKRAYQELTAVKIRQPSKEEQLSESVETMVVAPKSVTFTSAVPLSLPTEVVTGKTKLASAPSVSAPLLKLVGLVKKGRVEAIDNHFARTGLNPSQLLPKSPRQEYDQRRTPTLLHLASFHGQSRVVQQLLEKHGADPTVTISSLIKRMDKTLEPVSDELLDLAISAKPWTAYDVAKDKETRNAFRRAMARMPDAWDWTGLARVPSALTAEMDTESQKQSRSKSNGGGKDEVAQDMQALAVPHSSFKESPRFMVQERIAADREKRAQAAEARRSALVAAREMRMVKPKGKNECTSCGTDLEALSPFERFGHQCDKQSKLAVS